MAFADNVKRLREAKNYSQAELAELVGVSQPMINYLETGRKIPTVFLAVDIARNLETTVEQLVDGDEGGQRHEGQ
jgi:putative transcriptional regulator